MAISLRTHWKLALNLALALAVIGTLGWAWGARKDFARSRSTGSGLTTLDPEALAQTQPGKRDPGVALPPPTGTIHPLDPILPLPGAAGDIQIETESDRLVIELSVPNLNEASLQIEAERQSLRVTGEQETIQEERDATGRVVSTSRSSSSYSTSFSLPEPVQPDGMTSHYENGRLRIEIPRLYSEA